MAVSQSTHVWLTHRYREQVESSHRPAHIDLWCYFVWASIQ